jgi:hypothetical protein
MGNFMRVKRLAEMRKLPLIFLGVIAGAVSHKYERGCQLRLRPGSPASASSTK